MKTLALLLLLAGGTAALADTDLLTNSDFSDGISHWEGDCHTAGGSLDDSGATTGVVVKMRSGEWTKINQDFEGKTGDYVLAITYSVTPGASLSQRADDYTNVPLKMELSSLSPIDVPTGKWCVMVVDTGIHRYHYWTIIPNLAPSGTHTLKLAVELNSGEDFKKGFFLGFPPGEGSINIQSITLLPAHPSTAAAK